MMHIQQIFTVEVCVAYSSGQAQMANVLTRLLRCACRDEGVVMRDLQDRKVSAVDQEDDREILIPLPPISKELEAGSCCWTGDCQGPGDSCGSLRFEQ